MLALSVAVTLSQKVEILTDDNYASKVKDGIWLIKFYAPWCGHCKKLAPTWEKLAEVVGDSFHVAEVDCTVNTAIAASEVIHGYPTIKFIEPGLESAKEVRVQRTVKSFVDYVVMTAKSVDLKTKTFNTPEEVIAAPAKPKTEEEEEVIPEGSKVIVLDPTIIESEIAKGPMMIKIYAPWCGHCKKLAPIWEDFAKRDHVGYRVAKIDAAKYNEIADSYGIEGFPTILFVAKDNKPVEFSGPRTVADLEAFADSQFKKLTTKTEEPSDNKKEL